MIMCHLKYEEFWGQSIKYPYSKLHKSFTWSQMVHDNIEYCQNLPIKKHMEFKGKCQSNELPSFHPYWKVQVALEYREKRSDLIEKYNQCKIDPNKIKFLFNSTTSLEDIKQTIDTQSEYINILTQVDQMNKSLYRKIKDYFLNLFK